MPSVAASCNSPKRWGTPTAWPIRWWACSPPPAGWDPDAWRSATRKSCSRATHRWGPPGGRRAPRRVLGARHARSRGDARGAARAHRLARPERHRDPLRARRRGAAGRRDRLLRLPAGGTPAAERGRHGQSQPRGDRRAQARPRDRDDRRQQRGNLRPAQAPRHPDVSRRRPPRERRHRPYRAARCLDRARARDGPRARAPRAAHRGGQTRGRAAAAAARPLRPVARAAHRPGAHGARDRADPARRRGARPPRRGRRVPALQPRGGPGEGARGDPPRQPPREHPADRRDEVAASHEPARDPRWTAPPRGREPPPPLRSARRGRPRAARARDPPRGVQVSPQGRLALVLGGLAGLLVAVAAAALFLGSAPISPGAVIGAVTGRAAAESVERVVTLSIRLPRIAVAALAGGALAVAGGAFQALTRNPLAEPSVLGISGGAAFGVVIGQRFGLGLTVVEAGGPARFSLPRAPPGGGPRYPIAPAGR